MSSRRSSCLALLFVLTLPVKVAAEDNEVTRVPASHLVARVPGAVDRSFGMGGMTAIASADGTTLRWPADVALQSDGKIVILDSSNGSIQLIRLNAGGRPDPSFGEDGTISSTLGLNNENEYIEGRAASVSVQRDGKILVGGSVEILDSHLHNAALLTRYNNDGSPDETFGEGGTLRLGGWGRSKERDGCCVYRDFALQSDGKILILYDGTHSLRYGSSSARDPHFIERHLPDGTLDESFEGHGRLSLSPPNLPWNAPMNLFVQEDDRIIVTALAGGVCGDVLVARYEPDGRLDRRFGGGDGFTTIKRLGESCPYNHNVAYDPAGSKIIFQAYNRLAWLESDGSGRIVTARSESLLSDIAVLRSGKVVAAVLPRRSSSDDPALYYSIARYDQGGSLDTTFQWHPPKNVLMLGYVTEIVAQDDGGIIAVATNTPDPPTPGGSGWSKQFPTRQIVVFRLFGE